MGGILKGWKIILAIVLVLAAIALYRMVYIPEQLAYENKKQQIESNITNLQQVVMENRKYAEIQDLLEDANLAIDTSRQELYEHFPVKLLEEDQIMYILYLEYLFGTEIQFQFAEAQPIVALHDGATLCGVTLTVNYECQYDEFKSMVRYLSTDSRLTSVQFATMEYDEETDVVTGTVTLTLYTMDTEKLEYQKPSVLEPETGKENIFN